MAQFRKRGIVLDRETCSAQFRHSNIHRTTIYTTPIKIKLDNSAGSSIRQSDRTITVAVGTTIAKTVLPRSIPIVCSFMGCLLRSCLDRSCSLGKVADHPISSPIKPRPRRSNYEIRRRLRNTEPSKLPRTVASKASNGGLDRYEGGCRTVAGRIERKALGRGFPFCARSPYNKPTMEAGWWGIWALRPDAESVSYVLST